MADQPPGTTTIVQVGIIVHITGASRPAQVTENMQAREVVPKLTPEVMARIDAILDNKPDAA